jgi:hypothetical protein
MMSTRRGGGGGPIGAGRCGATSAWVRQVRAVDGADMRRMETGERGPVRALADRLSWPWPEYIVTFCICSKNFKQIKIDLVN